ncbi:hypothetical protein EDC01DRAFT_655569 [Geopyxis carbonaria]|nr:hypothetical protein EDC01DRAFT_655569 [Geopyxis carbonaria]
MSLQKSQAAFKSSLAGAADKLPTRAKPPLQPVAAPAPDLPAPKRKRPLQTSRPTYVTPVHSQPANASLTGHHILTQVRHAIQHLKEKERPLTASEISSYLSIPVTRELHGILAKHDRIYYDAAAETYEFVPVHGIRSAVALLEFLQQQTTAQGLSVKELKDGWAGALDAIDSLEAEGRILVTRTKKDNQARMVWGNDPSLDCEVDEEFKTLWHSLRVPAAGDLPSALEAYGLKPASIDPSRLKKEVKKVDRNRKRANNRRAKVSNTHMSGILKDSKDLRK